MQNDKPFEVYTLIRQTNPEEFDTLSSSVLFTITEGGGQIWYYGKELVSPQIVLIDTRKVPTLVRHVQHPQGEAGEFRNERPFLRLVANQVRRFTRRSVEIQDSIGRTILI